MKTSVLDCWGISNEALCWQLNGIPEACNSWCCYSAIFLHCLTNYTKVKFVMKSKMYLANFHWLQRSDEAWCFWKGQFSKPKMFCHVLPEFLAINQNIEYISFLSVQNWSTYLAQHCKLIYCYHDIRDVAIKSARTFSF